MCAFSVGAIIGVQSSYNRPHPAIVKQLTSAGQPGKLKITDYLGAENRLGAVMEKHTKFCELKVFLKNGHRAVGLFHVPMRTSSAIRPSDALQEKKNDLLLLSDVTLYENNTPRQIPAILMPYDAVSYIELPSGWSTKEEPEPEASTPLPAPAVAPTPKPASPLPLRPATAPPATLTPKWMAQRTQPK